MHEAFQQENFCIQKSNLKKEKISPTLTHRKKLILVRMQYFFTLRQSKFYLLITVYIFDNYGRSTYVLIDWGQTMAINMLNKESAIFRSISSVSLLLSQYEISQWQFNSLKSHMLDYAQDALLPSVFSSSDKIIPPHISLSL